MTALADRRCAPCNADTPAMDTQAIQNHLDMISDRWEIDAAGRLVARLKFKNYYRTQAFVNAVAYIAHREGHHRISQELQAFKTHRISLFIFNI